MILAMMSKFTGFGRLLAKRGRRRIRCSHCPRTFSAQSSVWRHVKTHHTNTGEWDLRLYSLRLLASISAYIISVTVIKFNVKLYNCHMS